MLAAFFSSQFAFLCDFLCGLLSYDLAHCYARVTRLFHFGTIIRAFLLDTLHNIAYIIHNILCFLLECGL